MYRYSARAPAADPAHYMYSAFEGEGFLSSYLDDRESLVALLPPPSSRATGRGGPPPSLPCALTTADVATLYLEKADGDAKAWRTLAEFFLRRVEVARCLRRAYGNDGLPAGAEEAPFGAYIAVAKMLASEVASSEGREQLRWLNGLLKLLDIASHRRADAARHAQGAVLRECVAVEIAAVRDLAQRMQLGHCFANS